MAFVSHVERLDERQVGKMKLDVNERAKRSTNSQMIIPRI